MGNLTLPRLAEIGSHPLTSGETSGAVSFAALGWTPESIRCSVSKPADGLAIRANPIAGTLTETGFAFELIGVPDGEGYTLNYVCELLGDGH